MYQDIPKIFISYRRDDSAYPAHAIYDTLASHFGASSVVFDVKTIPIGADFRTYLNDAVSSCNVLLAVIGDNWTHARMGNGRRRIDDPRDFTRLEIQTALEKGILVVPVLVGNATMPRRCDLPRKLKHLADRQAAEVRTGLHFETQLSTLLDGLQRLLSDSSTVKPSVHSPPHDSPTAAMLQ